VCDCKIGFFERVVEADVAIGSHSGRRQQRGWFFAVASHSSYTNRHR
jgi:hypothetical protein